MAWGVYSALLATAIAFYMVTPTATVTMTSVAGTMSLVSGFTVTTVVVTTRGSAVVPAVIIGVAAGGIGALNTLRDKYKIVEKDKERIRLQRK